MNKLVTFILLAVFSVGMTLFSPAVNADGDSDFDILERLFAPKRIAALRVELEQCVLALEFVSEVVVSSENGGATVNIEVTNNSRGPIWGLVVQSDDPAALELGLGGQGIMEFGILEQGQSLTHSEFVPALDGLFNEEQSYTLAAIDVIGTDGIDVISYIFESRWPFISSAEELNAAQIQFCDTSI